MNLNRYLQNRVVVALAEIAEEAFADFVRLDDDPQTDPARLERAAETVAGLTLALASLPASSGRARMAKARAAYVVLGPLPTGDLNAFTNELVVERDAIIAPSDEETAKFVPESQKLEGQAGDLLKALESGADEEGRKLLRQIADVAAARAAITPDLRKHTLENSNNKVGAVWTDEGAMAQKAFQRVVVQILEV
jgi:hypothetical protein